MNKIITAIVILVIVVGGWMLIGRKTSEAPVIEPEASDTNETSTSTSVDTSISTSVTTGAVKEFAVTGSNFSFTPSTITVKKGDRVKITFSNTSGFHDFKIDEYGVATKQTQSPTTEVLEFTADKVGSFEYYCSVGTHRAMGMKGTLIVES